MHTDSNDYTTNQFIEISRHCREQASNVQGKDDLNGFFVLIVDLYQETPSDDFNGNLVFSANLDGLKMKEKKDESIKGHQYYLTIGTPEVTNVDVKITASTCPVQHVKGDSPGRKNAIPHEDNFPKLVILIKLLSAQRTLKTFKSLALYYRDKTKQILMPTPIDANTLNLIRSRMVDLFVYGKQCSEIDHRVLKKFSDKIPRDCSDVIVSYSDDGSYSTSMSYSKCYDDEAFSPLSFRTSSATPGTKNHCVDDDTTDEVQNVPSSSQARYQPPYKLDKQRLKVQAQEIIVNCWTGLRNAKVHPEILSGHPLEVTSKLLGVSEITIRRIKKRKRENVVTTPGKIHKGRACRSVKVDLFDQERIRKIISNGFQSGSSLTAKEIYDAFILEKHAEHDDLQARWELDKSVKVPETRYTLGMKTFRKVLKLMGFRWRRIDQHARLMQRPDLAGWRAKVKFWDLHCLYNIHDANVMLF